MSDYLNIRKTFRLPRLPLEGRIDLTYRCNNNCLHCWLRIPRDEKEEKNELSLEEIEELVNDARQLGCRRWSISGGEPMLRVDFADIFDYITSKSVSYSINTNGTLITRDIAKLLKRKGSKLIALYGATPEVNDHITRNPGSFAAAMQGIAYLKEAGVVFTIQIIPMKENFHQIQDMMDLAKSLSPHYRIGAAWLHFSAHHSPEKNQEISSQRLPPKKIVELDEPDLSFEESMVSQGYRHYDHIPGDDRIFLPCLENRRNFHVDPYGQMSFCDYIKDPNLRYDLRAGNFREGWEEFIPSLAEKVRGGKEYLENCGACDLRDDCRWCPVFGFLEHRRYSARVEYLCEAAREKRKFIDEWKQKHRRYYQIAGMTIKVEADLPITEKTFAPKFKPFEVKEPGGDVISIRHHFSLPDLKGQDLGQEVYRKSPWAIYRKNGTWIYLGIAPTKENPWLHRVVVFNHDHSQAEIYNIDSSLFEAGELISLTLFPSDQILLARVLADREGCFMHSSGVKLGGKGYLFVGHSDAGKSTLVKMLKGQAEILSDDRIIIKSHPEGLRIHGTWSHGEVPDVSAASAPLDGIFLLEKSGINAINPVRDKKETLQKLLACLIKPFVTANWWENSLSLLHRIVLEAPSYTLQFDKSGEIVDKLVKL